MFTVWLVRRCHYSCLWQQVRGQGVGVEPGGERLRLREREREQWRTEWVGLDCCGGIKLTIGAAASFECPRSSPQALQGDPRGVKAGGAAGIQPPRWHRLLVLYLIAYPCSKSDLWFNNGLLRSKVGPTLLWFHLNYKIFHSWKDHDNRSCSLHCPFLKDVPRHHSLFTHNPLCIFHCWFSLVLLE